MKCDPTLILSHDARPPHPVGALAVGLGARRKEPAALPSPSAQDRARAALPVRQESATAALFYFLKILMCNELSLRRFFFTIPYSSRFHYIQQHQDTLITQITIMQPLFLSASPRPGGNSDAAIRLFCQGYEETSGETATPLFLRNEKILPCVACNACSAAAQAGSLFLPAASDDSGALPSFGCPCTRKDDSASLLYRLMTAQPLCLVSPIYFYHLPAQLKALIDRTQPFWMLELANDKRLAALPPRLCHLILIAARHRGEQLFTGSLLTLRQAFKPLNLTLAEPLLLRGLDTATDLLANESAVNAVLDYGRNAALTRNI